MWNTAPHAYNIVYKPHYILSLLHGFNLFSDIITVHIIGVSQHIKACLHIGL